MDQIIRSGRFRCFRCCLYVHSSTQPFYSWYLTCQVARLHEISKLNLTKTNKYRTVLATWLAPWWDSLLANTVASSLSSLDASASFTPAWHRESLMLPGRRHRGGGRTRHSHFKTHRSEHPVLLLRCYVLVVLRSCAPITTRCHFFCSSGRICDLNALL